LRAQSVVSLRIFSDFGQKGYILSTVHRKTLAVLYISSLNTDKYCYPDKCN